MQLNTIAEFDAVVANRDYLPEIERLREEIRRAVHARDQAQAVLTLLENQLLSLISVPQIGDTLLWLNGAVSEQGVVQRIAITQLDPLVFCWHCLMTSPPATTGNVNHGTVVEVRQDMHPTVYKKASQ